MEHDKIDYNQVATEYDRNQLQFKRIEDEAKYILEMKIRGFGIKSHTITSRIKEKKSFIDKVKRKEYDKPFEQIQDIVGIRVVCLFLSDVEKIGDLIRETFDVVSEDNKVDGHDTASFGYMSVHFIAKIKSEYHGERYNGITDKPFEIQVRTISMDAWANISHYLDYKSEQDIPNDLKKDFHAISGLFYVADKHFEMFFKSSQQSKNEMEKIFVQQSSESDRLEINLDSMMAYLQNMFPNRQHADAKNVSELVHQLTNQGNFQYIGEIDPIIKKKLDDLLTYERKLNEEEENYDFAFQDIGIVRMICFHSDLIDKVLNID